jgi:cobalt-zinc-cadmium efflux system outer membrane protein
MRLEQFRQFALAANPTLAEANAFVKQSAGQTQQSALYPNPMIGYQGEQIRGGSYGGGEQGAFVQQTIVLGGKLGLRKNVYEQQRHADEIGAAEQRYRILSDVDQSFYSALAAQQIVDLRKRLLALALDAVTTARQLANVGQADAPDVLQAEVEAEQAKIENIAAQRNFIQSFSSLAAIAAKPEIPVSRLEGELERMPAIDTEHIIDSIVRDSPSVQRAGQEAARADAALKSAKRESIPDLQLRAGVQQNFERLNGSASTPVGLQAFATAGVSLPLFNRNQGNVAAARAGIEQSRAAISRVQLQLRQRAQSLVQGYLVSRLEAERYKSEMIPRAARAYQLYLVKYQQMGAAYPQVLVSQRTLFQLQVAYINALQRLWMNAIALQNFTLSSGLASPAASENISTNINLPDSGGGAP